MNWRLGLATYRNTKIRIVIVGLGGTGGYVSWFLFRLLHSLKNQIFQFQTILCDGDIVEEKNILRQNFVEEDIGRFKTDVLAERYGSIYDLDILSYPYYVENKEVLSDLLFSTKAFFEPDVSILCGCVDRNSGRILFHNVFAEATQPLIYVDSGNDLWDGQVVLGAKAQRKVILPPVAYYYPNILSDTESLFPSQESCQDRAVSNPQNIDTNIFAGKLMFGFLNQLIAGDGLVSHGCVFNAETGQSRPLWIEDLFEGLKIDKTKIPLPFTIL